MILYKLILISSLFCFFYLELKLVFDISQQLLFTTIFILFFLLSISSKEVSFQFILFYSYLFLPFTLNIIQWLVCVALCSGIDIFRWLLIFSKYTRESQRVTDYWTFKAIIEELFSILTNIMFSTTTN